MIARPEPRLKPVKRTRVKRGWRVALGSAARREGRGAEWVAAALLMVKGYQVLGFRLRTRAGEIDLLVRRGRYLVVVEVKRRANLAQALTAISPEQYDRLLSAGRAVLRQRPSLAGHALRIDIVALAPGRLPRHRRHVAPHGRGRQ